MHKNKKLDNIGIWINGAKVSYGWGSWEKNSLFASAKRAAMRVYVDDVEDIEGTILSFKKKTVGKHEYWYLWESGKWKSKGAVAKGDPRVELRKDVEKIQKKIKTLTSNIDSVILEKSDDHLIVDIKLMRKYLTTSMPAGVIKLQKILKKMEVKK